MQTKSFSIVCGELKELLINFICSNMIYHSGYEFLCLALGKAKSVQQTTDGAGASPAPESPAAGDGGRRLRARRARPAETAPDSSDEYGPRSPSSGESGPEPDDWQPGGWHD